LTTLQTPSSNPDTIMAPSAITPPPQHVDNLPSTEKLSTTRKIVIFSGKSSMFKIVGLFVV